MTATTKTTMTAKKAFSKMLDDKTNGLEDNLRRVWRYRNNNDLITVEKVEYQLRKFGFTEVTPGAWV